ncbi:Aldehyde dehydrogenase [Polaromonas sp. CG9_12]|nr:Aldehyde dehydrogenase [Polaromonas sp. CG9_12]
MKNPTFPTQASGPIAELVARARVAQRLYETWSQEQVDTAVVAAGWAIIEPARNRELAELAVADTGVGNVEDKVRKNHRKTLGLLRDLRGARSVGVIAEDPARGLVEIARPVGVVCAITPSTNPRRHAGQQDHQCAQGAQCRDRGALAQGLVDLRAPDRIHPRTVRPHRRAARPGPVATLPGQQTVYGRADDVVRPGGGDRLAGQRARGLCERHAGSSAWARATWPALSTRRRTWHWQPSASCARRPSTTPPAARPRTAWYSWTRCARPRSQRSRHAERSCSTWRRRRRCRR